MRGIFKKFRNSHLKSYSAWALTKHHQSQKCGIVQRPLQKKSYSRTPLVLFGLDLRNAVSVEFISVINPGF
jgi:hypothetical protein